MVKRLALPIDNNPAGSEILDRKSMLLNTYFPVDLIKNSGLGSIEMEHVERILAELARSQVNLAVTNSYGDPTNQKRVLLRI